MPGPHPALAAARHAVRQALAEQELEDGGLVLVACSGGADSLALAAATAFVAPRLGLRAGAVVVDHGLQDGSSQVAEQAARQCRDLGLDPVEVVRVEVGRTGLGPEADAREARYAALRRATARAGGRALLLGHTRDDQAEQVLLGLLRGSGARSLSGMAPVRPGVPAPLLRPLLALSREQTREACAALGLEPWEDPHNADPRYARVRARGLLAELEESLGTGVRAGLARSAELLRDDADALDEVSGTAYRELGDPPWEVSRLLALPRAVRTRLYQRAAVAAGSPGTDLKREHLLAVDALLTQWRGQGPLHLPGGVRARRAQDRLWLGAGEHDTMGSGTMGHDHPPGPS